MSSIPPPPGYPQGSVPEPTWHDETSRLPTTQSGPSPWATPAAQGDAPASTMSPTDPPRRRRGPWLVLLLVGLVVLGLAAASLTSFTREEGDPAPLSQSGGLPQGEAAPVAPVVQADASAPDWSATAAAVSPSVVSITVESASAGGEGSGVVYDQNGHILTNHHVVAAGAGGKADILVTLADKRVFKARIVGTDPTTDLAVLALPNAPSDLRPITPGDDRALKVGQPVMAIGNPLGLSGTVTTGIVSALNRPVATMQESQGGQDPFGTGNRAPADPVVTNAIQTSAAINPGNSGGALVDASGKLVGINSAIASMGGGNGQQSGNIGIGFAIPVTEARTVAMQLIEKHKVAHPYLGVRLRDVLATEGPTTRRAAGIVTVDGDTPAAQGGLRPGDAVIAVDGVPVDSALSLTAQVRAREVAAPATLTIVRDGDRKDVRVTLAARP
ncbi:S1C family serine protease [Mobilicoccus pelagius]|uniref:Peptidase S1 family protein n=1 Tax=Mobilicoccus pelagius NBRC 104925 TaxID=1089455 RepID=H5URJ8_9MICO|nr:trypsin-like peptidase domain-containing protein [Mobilicoccus pelagius]GAB48356.1 peptidase S1 family protein [Mobilicoccus pelagius NBRC 104925]